MNTEPEPQPGRIHTLIPKIMAEVGAIEKSRRNPQQGYAFRGIDDCLGAFQSLFAKHGVFVVPTVLDAKREERTTKSGGALIYTFLTIRHRFYADDGSYFDAVTVGEAMDSGDKSGNKSMSAALKYALLEVFCVPTEDDKDTENHSPEVAPRVPRSSMPEPSAHDAWEQATPAPPKTHATAPGKPVGASEAPGTPKDPEMSLNVDKSQWWRQVRLPFTKYKDMTVDDLPRKTLFGFWANWHPKPYQGRINAADSKLRMAFDEAGAWYGFKLDADDKPTDAEGPQDDGRDL